mmetsp:Transcript_37769/g.112193  ORF Transcript_37769/g.112193 Transcript_37769/m.112193 type:complete len:250 (-) Transcript_37769:2871-3620(-)
MPSLKGSSVSTSSSSASPPRVIIWYISFSFMEITEKPSMNSSRRCCRRPSRLRRASSRALCTSSYSPSFDLCSESARLKSSIEVRFGFMFLTFASRASMRASTSARTTFFSSCSSRSAAMARRASSWPSLAPWPSSAAARRSWRMSRGSCLYSERASCSFVPHAWMRPWSSRSVRVFSSISFTRSTSWLFRALAAWMTSSRLARSPESTLSFSTRESLSELYLLSTFSALSSSFACSFLRSAIAFCTES